MACTDSCARIPADTLKQFMADVLTASGVPAAEAEICSRVLIASDLRGMDTHGCQRLKPIYIDRIRSGQLLPTTNFEIVRETPSTAVIDGHNGMGMVIAERAMRMAIDKAKKVGLGMVVVRNSTHYGIAGYYPTMASAEGMIGFSCTNARPSIAPTWGTGPMLGTNPLVYAFPSNDPFPVCLDCATSVVQRGKIEQYARSGKPCPPGWVIDEKGQTVTDSPSILKGLTSNQCSLLPVGGVGEDLSGYKGYGYALVVEILSSCLQTGNHMAALNGLKGAPIELGHCFMAFDINAFCDVAEFKAHVSTITKELRESRLMPGAERIYTPGEKEYYCEKERSVKGIPIPESLYKEMEELRNSLKLTNYKFPWEK